jgi:hypothetical protein
MTTQHSFFLLMLAVTQSAFAAIEPATRPFHAFAPTPPMGWNSWDCFGTSVTEAEVKANADYMAEKLKRVGYRYVVVDIQWYEPEAHGHDYRKDAKLAMDEFGRLLPAENRFPSAAGEKGFKPLADYVHDKGLWFGIHLLRGIPRQAVERNTPVQGTNVRARDIADKISTCAWNPDMYGVDMSKPGAQAYYDSVFRLAAEWGVDFVKVDDLSRPYRDHEKEIEAIRAAIDKTGRPMVFSTSPGETPVDRGDHVVRHANMWRISDDFWDDWPALLAQFERCRKWTPFTGPGHFPDADMLPVGAVRVRERGRSWTRFTHDEQYTLMSLWAVCRSPLIIGGDLPKNDAFTLELLTNEEVIAVNQHSENGRELLRWEGRAAWVADVPGSSDKYLAVFNIADRPVDGSAEGAKIPVDLREIGFPRGCRVRDLWRHEDLGVVRDRFEPTVPWHGATLVRLSK